MAPIVPLALCFCLGVAGLQRQAALPPPGPVWALAFVAGLSAALLYGRAHLRAALFALSVGMLAAGVGWADWRALQRLPDRLSASLEGRDLVIEGVVDQMPLRIDRDLQFPFRVTAAPPGVPPLIQLGLYRERIHREAVSAPVEPHAGERWRFTVRLKRPHGAINPHGFDYESMLFAQGIGATGYIRPAPAERLSAASGGIGWTIERIREAVRSRFDAALPDSEWRGVLVALTVGEQRSVTQQQWTLFARTGITHLISISGLHVVIWAVLAGAGLGGVWRCIPALALRLPAQRAAAIAGVLAAAAYCALAGWGVPAQRSLLMLAVAAATRLGWRAVSPGSSLALALFAVLLLDPWAVLGRGFWLSFGAVAILLYAGGGRVVREPALHAWLRAQWAMLLGMLPALLALTGQISLVAPLANAIAVPLVTLVILPLALCFAVFPLQGLAQLAAGLFDCLATGLDWLAAPDWVVWQAPEPPALLLAGAVLGAGWILLPRALPGRPAAWVLLLPLLLWRAPRPAPGEFVLTLLDVGQGLSVHVRTAQHDLLFDAGPRYGRTRDAGQRIVVPYLRGEGAVPLDRILISHEDSDHSGGADSVLDTIGARSITAAFAAGKTFGREQRSFVPCRRGDRWDWDGVRFEIIHPASGAAISRHGNATSCVLRLSGQGGTVLLAADIEIAAENELAAAGELGPVAAVVAPHHGSRSSSSAVFVDSLSPHWVLFPVGYRSRFGHPHPEVLARYAAAGAVDLRSDRDGAVRMIFSGNGVAVLRWREQAARYWHTPWIATSAGQ